MVQIRRKWLALILGSALAVGILSGCGGSGGSGSGGSTPAAKAPAPISVSIGSAKGSLQELTIPEQKKLTSASLTGVGDKLYYFTNPFGGDKSIAAYAVKGAAATLDKTFGKEGKLTEPAGIIGYANNISANGAGELYISNQSHVAQYKAGKVTEFIDQAIPNGNVSVPASEVPMLLIWGSQTVKMGMVMEGKLAGDLEPMPPGLVSYEEVTDVIMSGGKDPHVYISGTLPGKLSTITNTDSKLQYGNPAEKKAADAITGKINMFAVTGKYVVAFDSHDYIQLWSLDGKYIGKKELVKVFAEKPEAGFTSRMKAICAVGDTIYMVIENGKTSDDTTAKVYAFTLE